LVITTWSLQLGHYNSGLPIKYTKVTRLLNPRDSKNRVGDFKADQPGANIAVFEHVYEMVVCGFNSLCIIQIFNPKHFDREDGIGVFF